MKSSVHTAYCNNSGKIDIRSGKAPVGAIIIAEHPNAALLRCAIADTSRSIRKNYEKVMTIPGIDKARNAAQTIDALETFIKNVQTRLDSDRDQKPGISETYLVPRYGDTARRQGYELDQNPFIPLSDLNTQWTDDWNRANDRQKELNPPK